MDKKEALNKKPSLKKKLALEMKREKGEPPTKRVKEEYDVFKTDPVKLEREARSRAKKQRMEAPAQLPVFPIADPGARYLEYNKPRRIGFFQ